MAEGLEATFTLHQPGVYAILGRSSTSNRACESLMVIAPYQNYAKYTVLLIL
jgi:hypothetical protein